MRTTGHIVFVLLRPKHRTDVARFTSVSRILDSRCPGRPSSALLREERYLSGLSPERGAAHGAERRSTGCVL